MGHQRIFCTEHYGGNGLSVSASNQAIAVFVAAHQDYVIRVDGGVVRTASSGPGQVAAVIGGGSGHYPDFAGLVGTGLAAGAVCGDIFASPAAEQVYRVARAAGSGGGVLFSYGNYAGDVMQFGQAQQRQPFRRRRFPVCAP